MFMRHQRPARDISYERYNLGGGDFSGHQGARRCRTAKSFASAPLPSAICSTRSGPMLTLGLKNPSVRRLKCCREALLDHMVGEALAYVQGESLKANAAL